MPNSLDDLSLSEGLRYRDATKMHVTLMPVANVWKDCISCNWLSVIVPF